MRVTSEWGREVSDKSLQQQGKADKVNCSPKADTLKQNEGLAKMHIY